MTEYELACERSDPDWIFRARVMAHGAGTWQVPRMSPRSGSGAGDDGRAATSGEPAVSNRPVPEPPAATWEPWER